MWVQLLHKVHVVSPLLVLFILIIQRCNYYWANLFCIIGLTFDFGLFSWIVQYVGLIQDAAQWAIIIGFWSNDIAVSPLPSFGKSRGPIERKWKDQNPIKRCTGLSTQKEWNRPQRINFNKCVFGERWSRRSKKMLFLQKITFEAKNNNAVF